MPGRLTPRQIECLTLSATLHDQQIADRLGISVHTVRQHIDAARSRLGVQDRKAARRMLPQLEGYENQGMATAPGSPAAEPVAEGSQPSATDRAPGRTRRLYDVYVGLGRWREPPRIGGTRLPLIVLWAMISIGLVASIAMLQSVVETLGKLR